MKPYGSKSCYAQEDTMTRRSLEFQLMGYTLTKAQRRTLKKKGRNMGKKEIAFQQKNS